MALPVSWLAPVTSFAAYHLFLLALLLFGGFDVYDLLLVYYLELIVIGLHALLRMLTALVFSDPFSTERVSVSLAARLVFGFLLTAFFVSKYGLLMLALGVVILMLPNEIGMTWVQQSEVHPLVEWCLWILLVRYGAMYVWDSVMRSDFRDESVVRLLLYPYLRGLWVAFAIAAGFIAAAVAAGNPQVWFAAAMFIVRLAPDLVAVLSESRMQTATSG